MSKEAYKEIKHTHDVWQIYKHTGKEKYYNVFKDALNAATNEDRKSKRNFEYKSNMGQSPPGKAPHPSNYEFTYASGSIS